MNMGLTVEMLAEMGTRVTVLGLGRYALPVPFRIRGGAVECRVPTWCGVESLLEELGEVTLVAAGESGPAMRWLFIRGPATVVAEPDWEGLHPAAQSGVGPDDLYQQLRVVPKRIELIDEKRGWGYRETVDL